MRLCPAGHQPSISRSRGDYYYYHYYYYHHYYYYYYVSIKKQKNTLQEQSPGRVSQEKSSKIFSKAYNKPRVQEPFLEKNSGCRLATLFKKRLMHRFLFLWNFENSSEQLFYSTPVNGCLWFNWRLGNIDHHLRFRQMPENFPIIVDFA